MTLMNWTYPHWRRWWLKGTLSQMHADHLLRLSQPFEADTPYHLFGKHIGQDVPDYSEVTGAGIPAQRAQPSRFLPFVLTHRLKGKYSTSRGSLKIAALKRVTLQGSGWSCNDML